MKKQNTVIGLAVAAAVAAGGALLSFSPETDQSRTLGSAETRWGTVYTTMIDDGRGNALDVAELAEKNHATLTPESRAAANSHPISAVTGLADKLRPATSVSDGLMTAGDKSRLDNLDLEYLPKTGGAMTGMLTLAADPVNGLDAAPKRYADAADAELRSAIAMEEAVRADADAALGFRIDSEASTRQADDDALGALVDAEAAGRAAADVNLGDAVQAESDARAHTDTALGARIDGVESDLTRYAPLDSPPLSGAPTAPTAAPGTSTLQIANTQFVESAKSDAIAIANTYTDTGMAYKADLVGGSVPTSQLPPGAIPTNFTVGTEADLTALTSAIPNDRALVRNNPPAEPSEIWLLWAGDPAVAGNWQNITATAEAAPVSSVNGMTGAVTLDIANLPGVRNALDDKADAADLATRAPINNPTLTGTVEVPTASAGENSLRAANTSWVNTRIAATATPIATASVAGKVKPGTGLTVDSAGALAVSYGTAAGTAAAGNDARLSNARTPTAHATTHRTGGADALTASDIGALSSTGTAAKATALATARTIQTNLASTTAASFNGSANIAPGVTGVLPLANGGTGQATAALARNALGLGNTTGALPVANGGTGSTTAANALAALGGTTTARTISTTAPLTGGGNLTANRTLAISPATAATATAAGGAGSVVYAPDNAASTVRNQAVTPAGLAAAMAANGDGGFFPSENNYTVLSTSLTTFTAPTNGWIFAAFIGSGFGLQILSSSNDFLYGAHSSNPNSTWGGNMTLPMAKGMILNIDKSNGYVTALTFFPVGD